MGDSQAPGGPGLAWRPGGAPHLCHLTGPALPQLTWSAECESGAPGRIGGSLSPSSAPSWGAVSLDVFLAPAPALLPSGAQPASARSFSLLPPPRHPRRASWDPPHSRSSGHPDALGQRQHLYRGPGELARLGRSASGHGLEAQWCGGRTALVDTCQDSHMTQAGPEVFPPERAFVAAGKRLEVRKGLRTLRPWN